MTKAVLSIEEQLFHLETNKHLIIHDTDYAHFMLDQIGYFALISGYKTPFKNPTTGNYRDGVSFDDIVRESASPAFINSSLVSSISSSSAMASARAVCFFGL